MKNKDPIPDLYLVQQVSGSDQAKYLATYMSSELGTNYAAIVSEEFPTWQNSPNCDTGKSYQTNAILYRTDRLELRDHQIWQSFHQVLNPKRCDRNDQSRTRWASAAAHR